MPRFYIRTNTIYLRHNENYRTLRLTTGIKVPEGAKIRRDGLGLVGKDRVSAVINTRLVDIMADVNKILLEDVTLEEKEMRLKRIVDRPVVMSRTNTLEICLSDIIQGMEDGSIIRKNGARYSHSYVALNKSILAYIRKLWNSEMVFNIDDFDMSNRAPDQKKKIAAKCDEYYSRMHQIMVKDGLAVNTQRRYMMQMRDVLTTIERRHFVVLKKPDLFPGEEVPVTTLPQQVVKDFMAYNYAGIKEPELRYAYEICYMMLITSLRLSDACRLTIDDISRTENGYFLSGYMNKKTGERTYCPIPERLYNLLKNNHDKLGTVYSSGVNHVYLRQAIIQLFSTIPSACEQVTITRMNHDRSGFRKITKPFYQTIRPHMMRKSAITLMIQNGVSERVIKYTSGHTQDSKAFERYVGYVDRQYNEEMMKHQRMIEGG